MFQNSFKILGICFAIGFSHQTFATPPSINVNQAISEHKISTTQSVIAYFDTDSSYSATPVKDGFYRILVGRNAEGGYLVQDFFQNTGKIQANPYWINDVAGLVDFGIDYIDGEITGYYSNGKISFQGKMKDGQYIQPFKNYYFTGELATQTTELANGHLKVEYFYKNQKKAALFEYDTDGEEVKSQAWTIDGKTAHEQADEIEIQIANEIDFNQ